MNKKKEFDCVQFKYELQEKTLKNSGAKNLREYAAYVNKIARESSLHNPNFVPQPYNSITQHPSF
jgi:hypothetical protein